jgi:hypothetical protein
MDTARMRKIVLEAEAKIAPLEEALRSGDDNMAGRMLTILFGMMQDLKRLDEEESVPLNIDKGKLSETIDTVLTIMGQVRTGIDEHDLRLTNTNCFLLHALFNNIRELISGEKSEIWTPPNNARQPE